MSNNNMETKQKGLSTITILLIVLLVLILGGGIWYWYMQINTTKITTPTTTTPTTTTPTTTTETTPTTPTTTKDETASPYNKPAINYPSNGDIISTNNLEVEVKGTTKPNYYVWAYVDPYDTNITKDTKSTGTDRADSSGNFVIKSEEIVAGFSKGQHKLIVAVSKEGSYSKMSQSFSEEDKSELISFTIK